MSLQRPVALRWLGDLVDPLRRAWRQRAEHRSQALQLDAVTELSPKLLEDIGAPDWLHAEAAARREANAQRLSELRMQAGYRTARSEQW
jgi:hypothetical protein